MQEIRKQAAGLITGRNLHLLEEFGMTVIPKVIVERLHACGLNEEVIGVEGGKFVIIREATANDIERIQCGYVCMD